jgi:hypothetical protein
VLEEAKNQWEMEHNMHSKRSTLHVFRPIWCLLDYTFYLTPPKCK